MGSGGGGVGSGGRHYSLIQPPQYFTTFCMLVVLRIEALRLCRSTIHSKDYCLKWLD